MGTGADIGSGESCVPSKEPTTARLTDAELSKIIERDMPGHRIVRRKTVDSSDTRCQARRAEWNVDEVSPDIDALRRKYLGASDAEHGGEVDDEIVIVETERPSVDDGRARQRAVVISATERRIIGYQG